MGATTIEWVEHSIDGLPSPIEVTHFFKKRLADTLHFLCNATRRAPSSLAWEFNYKGCVFSLNNQVGEQSLTKQLGTLAMHPNQALRFPLCIATQGRWVVDFYGASGQFVPEPFNDRKVRHADRHRGVVVPLERANVANANTAFAIDNPGNVREFNLGQTKDRIFLEIGMMFDLTHTDIILP